jgi:opacity protein-like surface antigen
MKKIVFLPIVIAMMFMGESLFAQKRDTTHHDHLFHFGLKASPDLSWFNSSIKTITNDGSRLGFGYGLTTEFGFTKNYAFSTGLEIINAGGKLKFPDSTLYTLPGVAHSNLKDSSINNRTYKLRYIEIPLLLKLKSNRQGPMTYFGQFGLDLAVRWQALANDNITASNVTSTNNDVDISKDVSLMRLALDIGLGVEYNLQGSTSLEFSLNYSNGFTNGLKSNSVYLFTKNFATALQQNAVFNYVGLTIGVLF